LVLPPALEVHKLATQGHGEIFGSFSYFSERRCEAKNMQVGCKLTRAQYRQAEHKMHRQQLVLKGQNQMMFLSGWVKQHI
jgi:hypothetical protein